MTRTRFIFVGLIAIVFAVAAGTVTARWLNRSRSSALPAIEQPALLVDPHHLDFGEVWETDEFVWAVPVHNTTDKPIQASTFSSSCSCVAATSTNLLPPSATAALNFRINLRASQCLSTEPQASRDTKIRVSVGRDASPTEKPITVELHGRVKSAIVIPTRQIDFGRSAVTSAPKSRSIPINALCGLRELGMTVEGNSVLAELKAAGSNKWELQIRPKMPSIVGHHEAKVIFAPITVTGEQIPPLAIPVVFDVLHDIQPETSFVALGAGGISETLNGTLTIYSLSGRPFPLPECEGESVPSQTKNITLQSSWTFKIERKITMAGNNIHQFPVRGIDSNGKPFELRVELQWYGISR